MITPKYAVFERLLVTPGEDNQPGNPRFAVFAVDDPTVCDMPLIGGRTLHYAEFSPRTYTREEAEALRSVYESETQ